MKKNMYGKLGVGLFFISLLIFPMAADLPTIQAQESKGGIEYQVVPSAMITKVVYYLEDFRGRNTVYFEISVKNTSNEPKRFKLTVLIPDGPGAAYYYPREGNPPVLKPGEVHVQPLPLIFYDKLPGSFTIQVEEM
jgi:hypothetical protein